jgi:hypothetical protein
MRRGREYRRSAGSSRKISQPLGRVPIPHAGNGDPQGAAPGSDRLSKGPASVRAVRKHFPGFVWQSLRSGFAILPVRWVTAISSTRARVGVLADIGVEATKRARPLCLTSGPQLSSVAEAMRLASTKRSCLDPDPLGLELSSAGAMRGLRNRTKACAQAWRLSSRTAIASERLAFVQSLRELYVQEVVPLGSARHESHNAQYLQCSRGCAVCCPQAVVTSRGCAIEQRFAAEDRDVGWGDPGRCRPGTARDFFGAGGRA